MKDQTVPQDAHEELVAQFGETSVVRVGGRLELRGGPMSDRVEALEWLATFMPEATVVERS